MAYRRSEDNETKNNLVPKGSKSLPYYYSTRDNVQNLRQASKPDDYFAGTHLVIDYIDEVGEVKSGVSVKRDYSAVNHNENLNHRKSTLQMKKRKEEAMKRTEDYVSILVFGSSGVGKSSTIKHIIDLDEDAFRRINSESTAIREYVVKSHQCLGIIDSPGVLSSDGMKQDACNLASIQKFYQEHPEVANCKPNIIFVLINAGDKRFDGPNSTFVKSIKCLRKLNLVDSKYPNVVGVVTYAGTFARRKEAWVSKFESKKEHVKKIFLKYLNIEADVIALENYAEDEDYEIDGNNTVLPDGKLQPANLHEACRSLLSKNNDDLGLKVFKEVFSGKKKKGSTGFEVVAKNAKQNKLDKIEQDFLEFVDAIAIGDQPTEEFLEKNKIQDSDPKKKKKSVSIDKIHFLSHGCNLRDNLLVQSAKLYDYKTDEKFGIVVPTKTHFTKVDSTEIVDKHFETEQEIMQSRLNHINVGMEVRNFKHYKSPGFNLIAEGNNYEEYSILLEQRMFEMSKEDFADINFVDEFKSDVKRLPNGYVSYKDEKHFENFFDRWGNHLVTQICYGGSVEIRIKTNEVRFDREQIVQALKKVSSSSRSYDNFNSDAFTKILDHSRLFWEGGDKQYHHKSTLIDPDQYRKWKLSLMRKPERLQTEFNLIPMSQLVGVVKMEKEYGAKLALENIMREKETSNISRREWATRKCFPGSAVVRRWKDGVLSEIEVKHLKVGDWVQTKKGYSKVLLFAHYAPYKTLEYLKINTNDGHSVRLSSNHLIFISDTNHSKIAEKVVPGDLLIPYKSEVLSEVISIEKHSEVGFFCPVTEDGTIYVDGILTSCYASCKSFLGIDGHKLAHLGLLPMRVMNMKCKNDEEMHPYIKFLDKVPLPFRV